MTHRVDVVLGVLMCTVAIVGCGRKEPDPPRTCIEYAGKLVLVCEHQRAGEDAGSSASDCTSLYEQGYNACNIALESGVSVCVPSYGGDCLGYVLPPAPENWRGVGASP